MTINIGTESSSMNYKITNGTLLVEDQGSLTVKKQDLYVRDGKLSFLPPLPNENHEYEEFDARNMLVMPGLVNMHTHAYMTIMRNYADDVGFSEWLFQRVMPVEDSMPPEVAYWASLLACAEMIRTGTTCFTDMHMYHRQSPLAAKEAGMRAYIGRGLVGDDLFEPGNLRFAQALEEKAEFESDTLQFVLSPHAIYTCSTNLLSQVAQKSRELNMLKQIHLSESATELRDCLKNHGRTPVQLLNDLEFLDEKTILAHCVQMQGDDLDLIRASGASIVTNPASNAKLGNGFAPVQEMLEAGINLCIGTDGTASNNTLNLFREMGLLSLIHKGIHKNPTSLPAQTVIHAATAGAAKALGREGELGVIAEGALADLVFLDLCEPSMFPCNNLISSLCYSANGSEVSSVMINGRFVMRKRELLTIDLEKVYAEVQQITDRYLTR